MSNWFGSHWRWRVAMVLIAAVLIGYGWWQAGRWTARGLIRGAACPALYRVWRRVGSQSVEAFDWKTGRTWTVANVDRERFRRGAEETMRVSRENDMILWRHGRPTHLADIVALKPALKPRFLSSHYGIVGVSHDSRFAVFEIGGGYQMSVDGPTGVTIGGEREWEVPRSPVFILFVVELASGKIVSWRESQSSTYRAPSSEEDVYQSAQSFPVLQLSVDPWEPQAADWKLTGEGQWELLKTSRALRETPMVEYRAVKEPSGTWQLCERSNSPGVLYDDQGLRRIATSPDRFVGYNASSHRIYVGDFESKRLVESPLLIPSNWLWAMDGDGRVMVCSDRNDDILVMDVTTGKMIAKETSGSNRRNHLLAVGIAILLLAALWAGTALVESHGAWGVCDALIANLLGMAAVFPIYCFLYHDDLLATLTTNWFEIVPAFLLRGALSGAAIAVGWYWAFGCERAIVRWSLGAGWLAASALPVVLFEGNGYPIHPWMVFQVFLTAAIVASALIAVIAAAVRTLGWHIGEIPTSPAVWRFSLAMMFVLISIAGIGIMLVQSALAIPQHVSILGQNQWSYLPFAIGLPLVGVLFLRSRRALAIGIVLLTLFAMALVVLVDQLWSPSFGLSFKESIDDLLALASALPAIVLPCLVLRRHGWRWMQPLSATASLEGVA